MRTTGSLARGAPRRLAAPANEQPQPGGEARYTLRVASRDDWQRRLGPLYGGAVALVHSTSWRWPIAIGDDPRAAGWLVAIGVPIGAAAWVVAMLTHVAGLPATVSALFGLGALSVASAALVERGLAARVDHWERRDANTGVAAVLVLVLTTLVRAAAITAMPIASWLGVLITTAVVGRWTAMLLQALGDPIPAAGAQRSLVATPAPAWLAAAISIAVAVLTVAVIGRIGLLALAIGALAALGLGLEAQRRDGQLSAPVVATVAAIGELAVLLVASA